ncbi:MAG TPA: tyrosine-type recombinase/integrase [Pyrinomonadaceae bacterium]|nr:tyrosine-type recombinase/integrase [Pyrinomonadaceae bacterium]
MNDIHWDRFPLIAQSLSARAWLTIQANLRLASNTVDAYGRSLEDFFAFSAAHSVSPSTATREHMALYVHDLSVRPVKRKTKSVVPDPVAYLSNATMQLRLTAIRLYYDYLIEEGIRTNNPVGRGRYTPRNAFACERGLIPRYRKLPWIPDDEQWRRILEEMRVEPVRNRFMLALAYDAALRRQELCGLEVGDIDPARRLIRIRPETTKNRRERVVPYSEATGVLFSCYLQVRREFSRERGPLFLSQSRRNKAQPISIWTWSKIIEEVAQRTGALQFTTHTPRHLCLTDLARIGWDIHEIARFAGHQSTETTLLYIHLSGRDLAEKLARSTASLHSWRLNLMKEVLV